MFLRNKHPVKLRCPSIQSVSLECRRTISYHITYSLPTYLCQVCLILEPINSPRYGTPCDHYQITRTYHRTNDRPVKNRYHETVCAAKWWNAVVGDPYCDDVCCACVRIRGLPRDETLGADGQAGRAGQKRKAECIWRDVRVRSRRIKRDVSAGMDGLICRQSEHRRTVHLVYNHGERVRRAQLLRINGVGVTVSHNNGDDVRARALCFGWCPCDQT